MDEALALSSALLRVLVSSPDLEGLARLLFAVLTTPLHVRGVALLDPSRSPPRFLAHYCPDVLHPMGQHPEDFFRPTPRILLEAMDGRPAIEVHDHDAESHTMAAWPVGSLGQPLAVLFVIVDPDVDHGYLRNGLDQVASVTAVYLAGLTHDRHYPHGPAPTSRDSHRPRELTQRQRTILLGMAQGLTLRQISSQIAFSESTVRAESLTIYRYLGVHDRLDAVAAAQEQGLLDGAADAGTPRQLTID